MDEPRDQPVCFATPDALLEAVGTDLGCSSWLEITQERIDQFADATGDHQWIHVDPERAKSGPFGKTIAHGYLTLAISSRFLPELIRVDGASMGINYGVNKVRFPAPVPVGSRIRGRARIVGAEAVRGGVQAAIEVVIEIEESEKPACVVEALGRWLH